MMPQTPALPKQAAAGVQTLGVVSFLNALPLYESLTGRDDVAVTPAVPSRLYGMLAEKRCDVALLPVVDYWRARDRLKLVSDACIASDGETMTVRVFSKSPPDKVRRLHVDGDSHTSIVLAQLIWLELYDRRLELVPRGPVSGPGDANKEKDGPWHRRPGGGDTGETPRPQMPPTSHPTDESILLIGDKVVREAPRGFGFEVDLGAAWKHLTGLPFVFAAWYGAADRDHAGIAATLQAARDAGVAHVERIAIEQAPHHGWPEDVALKYLRDVMQYTLTSDMRSAIDRFFDLAVKHGLLP